MRVDCLTQRRDSAWGTRLISTHSRSSAPRPRDLHDSCPVPETASNQCRNINPAVQATRGDLSGWPISVLLSVSIYKHSRMTAKSARTLLAVVHAVPSVVRLLRFMGRAVSLVWEHRWFRVSVCILVRVGCRRPVMPQFRTHAKRPMSVGELINFAYREFICIPLRSPSPSTTQREGCPSK